MPVLPPMFMACTAGEAYCSEGPDAVPLPRVTCPQSLEDRLA